MKYGRWYRKTKFKNFKKLEGVEYHLRKNRTLERWGGVYTNTIEQIGRWAIAHLPFYISQVLSYLARKYQTAGKFLAIAFLFPACHAGLMEYWIVGKFPKTFFRFSVCRVDWFCVVCYCLWYILFRLSHSVWWCEVYPCYQIQWCEHRPDNRLLYLPRSIPLLKDMQC